MGTMLGTGMMETFLSFLGATVGFLRQDCKLFICMFLPSPNPWFPTSLEARLQLGEARALVAARSLGKSGWQYTNGLLETSGFAEQMS